MRVSYGGDFFASLRLSIVMTRHEAHATEDDNEQYMTLNELLTTPLDRSQGFFKLQVNETRSFDE